MMSGVLIVTGGSRGIGRAICTIAAQRGYKVCINYATNATAAETLQKEITAAGGTAIAVQADVSKEADVVRLFKAADALGPLTGLVNNAGIMMSPERVEDATEEKLLRVFGINVIGSFLCAREALRRMSTKHGGKGGGIVNVSSVAALLGGANRTVNYAASKGAIDSFTNGLAREVADEGVRVNSVRPGPVETEIFSTPGNETRLADMAKVIPMQRVGQPEEVAYAVLWLLSDEASFVTGTTLGVSGGR